MPFRNLARSLPIVGAALLLATDPIGAQPSRSLDKCQQTIAKETGKYLRTYADTVGKCLKQASNQVLAKGGSASDAARTCATQLAKIVNSAKPHSTIGGKFAAKIAKACDPGSNPRLAHAEADLYTIGAATLSARNLDAWCAAFGGDGSIDDFDEWRDCLLAASECQAQLLVAAEYPRALEYTAALTPALAALPASLKNADAIAALQDIDSDIEGATDDDLPELRCGPVAAVSASGVGLPKTGQRDCWNSSGSLVACTGTGQDGELRRGLDHNFVDNGDGTISDGATGLVWEKLCFDNTLTVCATEQHVFNTYDWDGALAKVAAMNSANYAGHNDWRLPNVKELESLLDAGTFDPAVDTIFHNASCVLPCAATSCSCTMSGPYWTSTSESGLPATFAWYVDFLSGAVTWDAKAGPTQRYARAVRGGV